MTSPSTDRGPRGSDRDWIAVGAALFIVALVGSALVVPELRPLHALQALMYVAVVVLARRDSPWGLGAGTTVAVAWNALNLLVTHLAQQGVAAVWAMIRPARPSESTR